MPWKIQKRGDKYCVVKSDGGKVEKCHADEGKAKAHLRALYGSEKKNSHSLDDIMAVQLAAIKPVQSPEPVGDQTTETLTVERQGVVIHATNVHFATPYDAPTPSEPSTFSPIRLYFREGEQTPDGRAIDPGAVNFNRPPPYAIRLQTTQPESGGHAGAVVCGVITKIARDGLTIVCDGFLDLTTASGQEAFNLISNRTMQTWSPDLGDAVVDTEHNHDDEDHNEASGLGEVDHYIRATFLGATLCAMPALASAVVELLDSSGNITVPAPDRNGLFAEPAAQVTDPGILKYIVNRDEPSKFADYAKRATGEVLTACAAPTAPPSDFFTDPQLPELQRFVTITPEGRLFTHVAGFNECHIGFRNQCVTISEIADCRGEGSFEYAKTGYVITADGSAIATGPISIKGGHAPRGLGWQESLSHYDDPSRAIADVVYGMDTHGIWCSGAIRPSATDDDIRTLRASGVSLDAREIDGKLRYLATCCVNTPGYPKVGIRLASATGSDGHIIAVTALGGPPQPAPTT